MKDQMTAFMKGRSTITSWNEDPDSLEFPTLTFCLDPATKFSVSQKYEFKSINDNFFTTISPDIIETFLKCYLLGKS